LLSIQIDLSPPTNIAFHLQVIPPKIQTSSHYIFVFAHSLDIIATISQLNLSYLGMINLQFSLTIFAMLSINKAPPFEEALIQPLRLFLPMMGALRSSGYNGGPSGTAFRRHLPIRAAPSTATARA
jgi:hypothetical protein